MPLDPSSYSTSTDSLDKTHDPSAEIAPAMRVQNLNFYYGTRRVLEGISIDIAQHQVTAIIGPSGCGKSTFIKALNRIGELETQVRVEGKVEFFGQNIYSNRVNINRLRQQIGMVFQKPNPFNMSIYENVAYGVRVSGPKSRTERQSAAPNHSGSGLAKSLLSLICSAIPIALALWQ